MFGGGVGVEGLLEHGAGQGVEGEPAVDLAVAVVPHRQPGGGGGVAFFSLQQFGFVGVGGVGGGDLEDVPAQLLEGFGVVVVGECEQVLLGLVDDVGVEVVGELGQGAEDGLGLLDVDPALGERGPGRVVAVETRGEPQRPVRGGTGGPGAGGRASSRSRWRRCCRRCRSGRRGRGAGTSARPAAPRRPGPRRWRRWSRWRPSTTPGPRDLAELIAHASEHPGDRVRLVRDRCHGPIPAPHADPRARPESPCGQGIPMPQLWTESGFRVGCGGFETALRDRLNHRRTAAKRHGNPIAKHSAVGCRTPTTDSTGGSAQAALTLGPYFQPCLTTPSRRASSAYSRVSG